MKKFINKIINRKYSMYAAVGTSMMLIPTVEAQAAVTGGIGDKLKDIQTQFGAIGSFVISAGFLGGVFFLITGILKIYEASKSQGQTKYTDGVVRLIVAGLLFGAYAIGGTLTNSLGLGDTANMTSGRQDSGDW